MPKIHVYNSQTLVALLFMSSTEFSSTPYIQGSCTNLLFLGKCLPYVETCKVFFLKPWKHFFLNPSAVMKEFTDNSSIIVVTGLNLSKTCLYILNPNKLGPTIWITSIEQKKGILVKPCYGGVTVLLLQCLIIRTKLLTHVL